jgi:prefoldin subunit 5
MESHLVQQQKGLLVKIPDISNALQALHHLMRKEEAVSCHFELADSVFANATIKKENTVLLWLGANVMLEYNYEEADGLLQKNLKVHRHPHTTQHAVLLLQPAVGRSSSFAPMGSIVCPASLVFVCRTPR